MEDADILIKKLKMISHPEGGHYVEVFKNEHVKSDIKRFEMGYIDEK